MGIGRGDYEELKGHIVGVQRASLREKRVCMTVKKERVFFGGEKRKLKILSGR